MKVDPVGGGYSEPSTPALTLRLAKERGWVSLDDGRTSPLPLERVGHLYNELFPLAGSGTLQPEGLTAAGAASLAEANRLIPRVDELHAGVASADPIEALCPGDDGAGGIDVPEVAITDLGPTRPFAELLATRRSVRSFGPLEVGPLGTALARAALIRRRWDGADGFPESSRPAASAGGRHPIILVVIANKVSGLSPGAWVVDPEHAVLRWTSHKSMALDRATTAVNAALRISAPPPAIVFAVAKPARTLSRYAAGMSLVWRDSGSILTTLELAATDLGLATCIAGTSGVLLRADAAGEGFVDTGALAVGGSG